MHKDQATEEFRDTISIVNEKGARKWVYAKKPQGRFYNARTIVSIFLLAFLFGMPFVKINGHPFLLLDVINRNFIIFGSIFTSEDYYLLGLISLTFIILLILITAVFGRIFCGWICPQTIFLEMVFRKIEYLLEGDYTKQMALDKSPWTMNKFLRKGLKYSIFFFISFLIANTFLAYIIGIDELFTIVTDPPSKHIAGLTSIILFSFAFYFVFAWFREQACILVCPYGRLQSVLLNQNSIVIAYDFIRGEPRGKLTKKTASVGDCIDCRKCVHVCPTGIDIRNGTQLECVNCTACIDACDSIMLKINKPKGLIRYDSYEGIKNKVHRRFTGRVAGYSILLTSLIILTSALLANKKDVSADILRTPGSLYQQQDGDHISNIYNYKIYNKTFKELHYTFKIKNSEGTVKIIGEDQTAKPVNIAEGSLLIIFPKDKIKFANTPVVIEVYSDEVPVAEVSTTFLGPVNQTK